MGDLFFFNRVGVALITCIFTDSSFSLAGVKENS